MCVGRVWELKPSSYNSLVRRARRIGEWVSRFSNSGGSSFPWESNQAFSSRCFLLRARSEQHNSNKSVNDRTIKPSFTLITCPLVPRPRWWKVGKQKSSSNKSKPSGSFSRHIWSKGTGKIKGRSALCADIKGPDWHTLLGGLKELEEEATGENCRLDLHP